MKELDAFLKQNYEELSSLYKSKGISKETWEDALHNVVIRLYETPIKTLLIRMDQTNFFNYVNRMTSNDILYGYRVQFQEKKIKSEYKVITEIDNIEETKLPPVIHNIKDELKNVFWFDRLVFEQYVNEDITFQEFSIKTNIPKPTLYKSYRNVLDKLKDQFNEE